MSFVKKIFDLDNLGTLISVLLGIPTIVIGVVILWQGYLSPIPKVEDYAAKEIIVEKCYVDENKDIILIFSGESYKINRILTQHLEIPQTAMCNNILHATVWIRNNTVQPFEVRGIKTSTYQISIEKGLILDDASQNIFFGWIIVVCGFIVLIIGVVSNGDLLIF